MKRSLIASTLATTMADTAFKDVPELFGVSRRACSFAPALTSLSFSRSTSGSIGGAHRKSRYLSFFSASDDSKRSPSDLSRARPDLCHLVKSTGRAGQRDVRSFPPSLRPAHAQTGGQLGSFHFVSEVDASSSASLAAYINSPRYAIEDMGAWFSKGPVWKVCNGCYCCFDAFSRVDVRMDVKIPGGVHAYVVDLRGT